MTTIFWVSNFFLRNFFFSLHTDAGRNDSRPVSQKIWKIKHPKNFGVKKAENKQDWDNKWLF